MKHRAEFHRIKDRRLPDAKRQIQKNIKLDIFGHNALFYKH